MTVPTDGIEVEVVPTFGGAAQVIQPGGGGAGTVTDVTSTTATATVATGTTTPKITIQGAPTAAAVPASALVAGTHVTITTTLGRAKVTAVPTAGPGGTVTDVASTSAHLTVTTPTTTPQLTVVSAPVATSTGKVNTTLVTGNPATAGLVLTSTGADAAGWAAPGAGTVTDVSSTTATATVATATTTPKLTIVAAPKTPRINTTLVTGNPATAGLVLTSTGADAAGWAAPAAKIGATAVTGNAGAAGQVLTATGADAAGWAAPAAPAFTHVSAYLATSILLVANTATNIVQVTLGAGTWLMLATVGVQDNSPTPSDFVAWLGPTSASTVGAYAGAMSLFGASAESIGTAPMAVPPVVVVLGAAAPVYLQCRVGTGTTHILAATGGMVHMSGIVAVRIG